MTDQPTPPADDEAARLLAVFAAVPPQLKPRLLEMIEALGAWHDPVAPGET